MPLFTLIFLVAVIARVGLELWLARRHVNHVLRHRGAVPVEFADTLSLQAHQRAADYTVARTRFGMLGTALDTVLLLVFTLGGGLDWIAGLLESWVAPGYLRELLLIGAFALITGVIALPFDWHRVFGIEERFGFNKMTRKLFLVDGLRNLGVSLVLGTPLLLAILWFINSAGTYWWLYAWVTVCVFMLFMQVIYPSVIAPLYNKFAPLEEGPLKQMIQSLLTRCGFTAGGLFVMDGSKRSRHSNAFFSGFGAAKRIVLFDTLIEKLQPVEIEAVLAHELGHFKRNHIIKSIGMVFAMSLLFFGLLGYLMNQGWFYTSLGVSHQSPAMALLLLSLVLPVFTFVLFPLLSLSSRKREFEADEYAAGQTSAAALISALTRIYDDNAATVTPDPLHSAFHDSHPPAFIRIGRLKAAT